MKHSRDTHGILLATLVSALALPGHTPPTGPELLRRAASTWTTTRALQFAYTAHGVTPGFRLAALVGGGGTIIWPDHLVFNGTMQSTPALAAQVTMVMCGPEQEYVEMGDGTFQQMPGLPDVRRILFAPDSGLVVTILTKLDRVSTPQAASLTGAAMWHVTGTVPNQVLGALPGRTDTAATKGAVRAGLWIGQRDQRLYQVQLTGPMFDSDSTQTTRTFTFSHFNEHLSLTVPRGQLPCGAKP